MRPELASYQLVVLLLSLDHGPICKAEFIATDQISAFFPSVRPRGPFRHQTAPRLVRDPMPRLEPAVAVAVAVALRDGSIFRNSCCSSRSEDALLTRGRRRLLLLPYSPRRRRGEEAAEVDDARDACDDDATEEEAPSVLRLAWSTRPSLALGSPAPPCAVRCGE